jgi:hypothetical protein
MVDRADRYPACVIGVKRIGNFEQLHQRRFRVGEWSPCVPWKEQLRSTALDEANLHATTTQRQTVEETLGGFAVHAIHFAQDQSIARSNDIACPRHLPSRFLRGTRFRSVSGTRMAAPSGSLNKSA